MAAYPSLPVTFNSRQTVEDGRSAKRASNGALKVRRLFASEKSRFEIEHELTSAQVATLDAFYGTNKDLDVTFTWPGDGVAYTVRFTTGLRHVPQPGGWFKTYLTLAQA